jgi:hypothetical protein
MLVRTQDTMRVVWRRDEACLWPSAEAAHGAPELVQEIEAPLDPAVKPTVYELRPLGNFEASGVMASLGADLSVSAVAVRCVVKIDTPVGTITDRAEIMRALEDSSITPLVVFGALRDLAWRLTRGAHADRPFRLASPAGAGDDTRRPDGAGV